MALRRLGLWSRHGVVGFRLIPAERSGEIRARLAERDCRLDTWDVFLTDRREVLAAAEAILSDGPPNGLRDLQGPTQLGDDYTARIQALMAESGVVPFSGTLLVGRTGQATTAVAGDGDGTIIAAAHTYLPHNAERRFRREPPRGQDGMPRAAGGAAVPADRSSRGQRTVADVMFCSVASSA